MRFENYMKLEVPSSYTYIEFICSTVAKFAKQLNPSEEEISEIRTAVSEAVSNCMYHAYPCEDGKIIVQCRILKENVLSIIVKDYGIGIKNVSKAVEPLFTTGSTDKHSGIGFTIMESFMTNCDVKSVPGKGTTVFLKKQIKGD